MRVVHSPQKLRHALETLKKSGKTIGFVPTMGALHEGHLSLVRLSKKSADVTVVSVFVNPLQFGPGEDFKAYPRSLKRDRGLLRKARADFLFVPNAKALYPKGFQTRVAVGDLSRPLCGRTRPLHFAGVATVVLKLLNLVMPDEIFLGQKDYQQFRVIEQMAKDLNVSVRIRLCPIIREKDGLAMSSRNYLLDAEERMQATYLNRALGAAETLIRRGVKKALLLTQAMRKELSAAGRAKIDYAEIVDASSLLPVVQLKSGQKVELALAVFFSKTRLIDNRLIRV